MTDCQEREGFSLRTPDSIGWAAAVETDAMVTTDLEERAQAWRKIVLRDLL